METRREASLRERGAAGGLEIRQQDATLSFLIQIQEKKALLTPKWRLHAMA